MLSEKFVHAIRNSWGQDTCYPEDSSRWSIDSPYIGQCAVTALLVQDLIGGEIRFTAEYNHYWNIVEGQKVDLTSEQFGKKKYSIGNGIVVDRSEILELSGTIRAKTEVRYQVLRKRFYNFISKK